MHIIGYANVEKLVHQFNLGHLTCERAPIKGSTHEDIRLREGFRINSIKEIVNLIGGHKRTREIVGFNLRNEPIHDWFAKRFVYSPQLRKWEYVGGQDYKGELQDIRNHFLR